MGFLASNVDNNGTITVITSNGTPYIVNETHPNYLKLKRAYVDRDEKAWVDNVDASVVINEYNTKAQAIGSKASIVDGQLVFDGEVVHHVIVDRIFKAKREGSPFEPLVRVVENLMRNPSYNSREQLYPFLEHGNMPVTDDGCFIAYKTVKRYNGAGFVDENGKTVRTGDLVDKWSSSIRNNVGDVVVKDRSKVDDNPSNHCSKGLHVGSLKYAGPGGWYNNSGDFVVLVKVNPQDAVSVPGDHSCQKLRVCKYEVVALYTGTMNRQVCNLQDDTWEQDVLEDENWDEDDVELFEDSFVDPEDLGVHEFISCWYTNQKGERLYRHVETWEDNGDTFTVRLLDGDPHRNSALGVDQFRTFYKVDMEEVSVGD